MKKFFVDEKVQMPQSELEKLAVKAAKKTKVAKPKKTRRARPFRVFRYQSIQFFLAGSGEQVTICTVNPDNGQPEPRITVEKSAATRAVQLLAKAIKAERELETICPPKDLDA